MKMWFLQRKLIDVNKWHDPGHQTFSRQSSWQKNTFWSIIQFMLTSARNGDQLLFEIYLHIQ